MLFIFVYLSWFPLCFLYHFVFPQDWEVLSHNFIKYIFYSLLPSLLLLWPLLGYVGILDVFSGFLKLFSIFLIILFAILFVWLSLFFLHKLPRWQRNMMRKPLYPPQIHQKINWMLSNFHKATSECWWRTPGTQKGSPISSKGGGRKFKRRKRRQKFRDRDPS